MTPSAITTTEEETKEVPSAAAPSTESAAVEMEPLIPGLPDEVAEQCLLHLPFPYQALARSVSSAWNRALSSSAFLRAKSELYATLSLPYLFVFAFHPTTLRLQWQALDPRTRRWFVLPPMPLPAGGGAPLCPPAFACTALPHRGEIYVLGGMRSDTETPLRTLVAYRAATNSWSTAAPMTTPRSFFAAGAIGGRIFAAGGGDGGISAVECYDPAADRWSPAAGMRCGMARYDAAVVGRRMYVTEGWRWPFYASPRAGVYDADRDAWEDMSEGMREGWTGASAVVGDRLLVVTDYGDGRVKAYDAGSDAWQKVEGGGVPLELKRPYAVSGAEGAIYVAGTGLEVAVGTVVVEEEGGKGRLRVAWRVVKGPPAFADLVPCYSQVLYV
ncbi:F-box protein AFR-like [Elaeis guineensis]|uniref:LOW QUALITY PROTEIN: F-box protein AFR-like n=1 Tax=Elaeis guineensis var. tenera TaxID=51953 RepID=A0A6I9QQG8_ELAGV|nr:LOW QUALITY PROTEIN: F-box protein AFR-like [Elaeis guineensis]